MKNLGRDSEIIGIAETAVASDLICDVGDAINTIRVFITGSNDIGSFGTGTSKLRILRFAGALNILSTAAALPGNLPITTSPGDTAIIQFMADGSVRLISFFHQGIASQDEWLIIPVGDETTSLTVGAAKATYRLPFDGVLRQLPRASLTTASSSGVVTVDIKVNGATIFFSSGSTLNIDAGEKSSVTTATPALISTPARAMPDDGELTIDITAAGTGAKGLKVYIPIQRS